MLKGQKIVLLHGYYGRVQRRQSTAARNIAYGERIGLTDDRTNIGKEYRARAAPQGSRTASLMPTSYSDRPARLARRHGIK